MANDNKDLGDFAAITPGTQPDLGDFARITPNGGKPRSAIGEIANQLKAGVLVDLPKMAGQAIQYTSDPGRPVYEFGKSIADYARAQEARPDLQPQAYDHNVVTNALAGGARMIPQSIVPALGVGLAASGVGAPAGAALLAGSVLGAAPAGMAQAEDTLEKARAQGISDDIAIPAARKTGLIEWGGESAGNYLGGKLFGLAGRAIGKSHAGTAAEQALEGATNTQVLKPWLRQLPETVLGEVGTEMAQNAGEAYVEQQAGIDNHSPWEAAKEAIAPTLGMTALLAPFGLAGHAVNAHRQQQRNTILTSPDADQQQRTDIVNQIAPEIEKVDAAAARNFRANADRAISAKQALTLDASLFTEPGTNAVPPAAAQPAIDPADLPDAGTEIAPANPMTAAARLANPMLPLREEAAQKRADRRTQETGIPHEVVPHPSAPGMFGVQPVQQDAAAPQEQEQAPVAPPAEATAPAAPVGLKPGDPVQVTLNGQDLFEHGTRIVGLTEDGQYAMVEGSNAAVPVTALTRIDPQAAAAFDAAAHEAATSPQNDRQEPSDAQKHAGNYKKGPGELQGLKLMIENPVGSTRTGEDSDGTPWSTTMSDHYGYIRGTKGSDGKELDVYVGPNPASHHVFVVDQINQETGEYDEHKIMLGYNSAEQAQRAYETHYAPGWQGGENVTATTIDGLKQWLKGDTTRAFNPAYFPEMHIPANDLFNQQQSAAAQAPTQQEAAPAPLSHQDKVDNDPFYPAALDALRGKTSVTPQDLQTQLNVGYNRAQRLLEQMHMEGFVSPAADDGSRTVAEKAAAAQQEAAPVATEPQLAAPQEQAPAEQQPATAHPTQEQALARWNAASDQRWMELMGGPENVDQNDGLRIKSIEKANEGQRAAVQGWGFPADRFNDKTHGNGLIVPTFEKDKRSTVTLFPGDNRSPQVNLAQGPNGKWGYGFQVWRSEYALNNTQGTFFSDPVRPDNRPQFDSREAALDAAVKEMRSLVDQKMAERIDASPVLKAQTGQESTAAPQQRQWSYSDGTPLSPRHQDLFTRAAQVYQSVLDQTPDTKDNKQRREQLREQIANPVRYAQLDEVENDKGLKIGDQVTRGKSDQIETVASITARDVNGKRVVEVKTIYPGSYGGWGKLEWFNKVGQDGKQAAAPEAKAQPDKPAAVDYPNRQLGFQKAVTDDADAYNDHVWANIAAANMKAGDTFEMNGKDQTVQSITDKTLKLKDSDGKMRTLNPSGVAWGQFQRDLGGQLTVENLQANNPLQGKRPLIDILKRDPAVHVDANGSVYLRDGGPVPEAKEQPSKQAAPRPFTDVERRAIETMTQGAARELNQKLQLGVPGIITPASVKTVRAKLLAMDPDQVRPHIQPLVDHIEKNDAERKAAKEPAKPTWKRPDIDKLSDYEVSRLYDRARFDDGEHRANVQRKKLKAAPDEKLKRAQERLDAETAHRAAIEKAGEKHGLVPLNFPSLHGASLALRDDPTAPMAQVIEMSDGRYTVTFRQMVANGGNFGELTSYPTLDAALEEAVDVLRETEDTSLTEEQYLERMRERHRADRVRFDEAKAAREPAPAAAQEKVHEYDEKEAKPLLIIACTDGKLAGRHKAIDLYQGALFDVLRKWMPKDAMDVYVLSAKHGLVHADTVLSSYDQKMTPERQKELIEKGVNVADFKGKNFSEVFVAGSQLYTPVGQAYAEQLRKAGFVGPDAEVKTTSGFIGQQRGQLGEYLRKVQQDKGTLPETPAPLEVGVRVRVKTLDKAPLGLQHDDYNRFAGRVGTVEREFVQGDNRYFIVNLDDTPDKVERRQEFWSGHLDVLTPAHEAGPAALSEDLVKRTAQIRERVDAILNADPQLVAQADLVKTGNRFQDFRDAYKTAFEKALASLGDSIPADQLAPLFNSIDSLPGYADRAARNFIADHHGTENKELKSLAHKWGYTPENTPEDGYFPDYQTALKYDNKRTGKEQLSFEIRVAQAPNQRWAYSFGYQQGGTGGNGIGQAILRPALTSVAYDTRMLAVEAAGAAIRQELRKHGVDALRPHGQILTAVNKLSLLGELREKLSALAGRALAAHAGKLAGQLSGFTVGMTADDNNLTNKWVKEVIAEREKLVERAEKKAKARVAQAPQPPQPPKQDAPGTRYYPAAVRGEIAERLQKLLDGFDASRFTREGAARSQVRNVIEELKKDRTVLDLPALLNEASNRLMLQFPAQAQVLDDVGEQLEEAALQAPEAVAPAPVPAKVDEAEAKRREKAARSGQRELFGIFSKDPALMKAVADAALPGDFDAKAVVAVRNWVEQQKAADNLDPDRALMLDSLVADGKVTLPREWFDSLRKYLKRAAARAEKELDRDPAVYQAELIRAAQAAAIPPDNVVLFKTGFDHALAGKTRSTLPPVQQMAQGYEAGAAWMKTDEGQAWYAGRRGKKLENTGAALRRWFDESSRRIKEVTADNLPASYAIIKDQASRVEAFANVAAENATPGTKRYITALRDDIQPFQAWLLDTGPLDTLYGEIGYRESESARIARFLDGRTYPYTYDAAGKRTSMEDATPEQRLELLQEAAATYNDRLRGLAEALSGVTSVAQAAQRYQDYMVKADKKDAYDWDGQRYTEAGKEVTKILRGRPFDFEPDHYTVNELLKHENDPDAPTDRKQALLVPKLDRVVREGENLPDYRHGKDVTPQQMKDTFGFADVGFGRYVAAKQDQDHLNYAYDAFMDLSKLLGIDPKQIGLGGTLHFTIGALGHGRHAAHFQARQQHPDGGTVPVINVTNTKGDGTVAHEWFHALDHALAAGWAGTTWKQGEAVARVVKLLSSKRDLDALADKVLAYAKGQRFMRHGKRNTPMYNLKTEAGLVQNAEHGLRWEAGQQSGLQTEYKKQADAMGEDYWGNPRELLARAAESWAHDTLGGVSNYLVNPAWVGEGKIKAPQYKGAPYPMGEERKLFNDAIQALVKSLRFGKDGVTVDMDTFEKEFPDVGRQFKEGMAALNAQVPSMVRTWLAEKEAIQLAAAHRKGEAERAAQAKTLAEQQAREAEAARLREEAEKQEQAAVTPPAGALSDADLEALFDQAENELAEEQQEQPKAPEPGEAARPDHWTQEDYHHLLQLVDDGKVFLLADPSRGLATIHDVKNAVHLGYGTFRKSTPAYEAMFEGGGSMKETPSGKAYSLVSVTGDRAAFLKEIGWDQAKTRLQAKLIVKQGPKAAPTLSQEQEKSAAKLIAEAAKLGVSGIDEALKGLTKLFGGNALKSFPSGFDEHTYREAKPHFEAALKNFQAAGKTLVDLFKLLIGHFGPGVRPYAIQFAKEKGLTANLSAPASATEQVANQVQKWLADGQQISSKMLFEKADQAFGGTQAEGKYSVKDAYDAMEAGVNRHIMAQAITPDGSATDAVHKIGQLDKWTQQLATQTRRTAEMDEFQQFSTPPAEAFAAAWVANIRVGEQVLEPSAGTGSLAIHAQLAGARVTVNELSARRAEVLKTVLPEARLFQENAEQLDNILPDDVSPSVIIMNPPFSSTAGRMEGARDTMNGAVHIEQALKRLAPGGRLVAIVGTGMAEGKPAFKAWWQQIKRDYNVRVNLGVDGSNYAKYGTTFDNQILVIDKTGPTKGAVLTGEVKTLAELPPLLEGVRNDRQETARADNAYDPGQPDADQPGGGAVPAGPETTGDRTGRADADPLGAGERDRAGAGGAGPSERGQHDGAGDRNGNDLAAEKRGEVPDQPGRTGRHGADGRGTGGATERGGRGRTADREPVQRDGGERPVSGEVKVEQADNTADRGEMSDAIFESYTPQRLKIPGAKPHPGKLVQSAAMAAVEPPAPSYSPNLPKTVIDKGLLSLAQLEAVVYAGQAHSQMLPGDKERRGFFIGDGTGVGKGREIAGILLDNWRSGRTKAVWLSAKQGLLRDARRDFAGVSGNADQILAHNKFKSDAKIDAKQGILFTTYDTLRSGAQNAKDKAKGQPAGKTRLDQIVEWLGEDFDGVIAFDEAHNMGNVVERKGKRGKTKPAAKALAGVELQRRLPKARVVYVSATGATEVHNLGYATRLGLWGEGSAFAKVTDFIGGIESGGVAAMELVSRDMKAQGSYLARSLSFDGVTYDRLEHELTPLQTDIYNELARGWQMVLENINAALEATLQAKNAQAKSAAMAQFWGSHQRFFNHVITAMQMPSIIESAQNDLAAGHAVVMQLVNTNEAEQERQAAKLANDDEAAAEDFDFTPLETLLNYVRNGFPIQQHEQYVDEEGHTQTRPVTDSNGNPVFNREMIAKRDALVKNLEQIRVPDNPLDMILRAFGTDNVAEITGRKRRFVQVPDPKTGGFRVEEQKRPVSAVPADADAFMEDSKRVLVFSDAGGTGYSFQSDLNAKNQRRRMHYLVQPGWRANNAVQGFGRTHRSNEANQPHYVLPTTNLKAQKRFISSIARRLDQLGALTKGQRETGGQGMFSATDNLESQYSADALHNLFVDMYNGQAKLDFHETTKALGLNGLIDPNTGALSMSKLPDVPQFLNRLLSLETTRQDEVFDEFFRRLEETIERARANGTFDAGMETLRADKVTKLRDQVVYEDKRTGAQTRYVELELTHPTHFNQFSEAQRQAAIYGDKFLGFYRNERTGKVFSLARTGTSTDTKTGQVVSRGVRLHPTGGNRYGDDVDKVLKGARGEKTVKKTIMAALYTRPASGMMTESYLNAGGKPVDVTDTRLGTLLAQRGLERVEQTIQSGPPGPERDAFERLLARMKPHLKETEAEREIPAFVKLAPEQAKSAWEAEIAASPATYTDRTHLLTGMLLPIWDRLPGDPRVVRTQTVDGERLLGRVVPAFYLDQTLKNLGVGSNLDKLPAATVLQRLLDGERGVLANGWLLRKVRVSNDERIEVSGSSLAYNRAERDLLTNAGAFTERINWQERVFIPTGDKGEQVLERLLTYKPLVDLGKEKEQTDDEAEFSRGTPGVGMTRADVWAAVDGVRAAWANAPAIEVVQSVGELPFKAPPDTRGASFRGKVYLVADNLAHEGQAQFVLAHEVLGHIGLRAILGPQALQRELNRLRMINPELAKAARAQAQTYGYDLNLATEEALADIAGSGKTIKGWQKFAAVVQQGLRAIGLDRVADWLEGRTQAETMSLLARAREAIEGSRAPRVFGEAQAAMFSRDGDLSDLSLVPDERLQAMLDQTYDSYYTANPTLTYEEMSDRARPIHQELARRKQAVARSKPATSTADVFPGFKMIPVGTKIRGDYGMNVRDQVGTVVGVKPMVYDGVLTNLPVVDFGGRYDEVTVLASQIKEVYAPRPLQDDDGVRFSRPEPGEGAPAAPTDLASQRLAHATPEQFARAASRTVRAITGTGGKFARTAAHYRSLALQFLGRLQLTDVYGHLFPLRDSKTNLMQQYSDLVAQMDAEKTEGSAHADEIAKRWARLTDERQLAELMHDVTRLGIDPSKDYDYQDNRQQYNELRARWEALSAGAQTIYLDALKAYEKQRAATMQAVRERITRSLPDHPNRAAMVKALEEELFGPKVKVYFPLARFGDYVITVRFVGRNPQPGQAIVKEAVARAETLNEAENRRAELLREYPPEQGYEVLPVIKAAEYNAARDSVSRGFLKKLFKALDDATLQDPSLQDTINQIYLTTLPDVSYAKTAIHRKGTPGFSQDARRAFAHHMFHGSHYLAKLNYSDQLVDTLEAMQKHADERAPDPTYNQVKAQQVIDEMTKRHDAYMNPKANRLSTRLTSLGFLFYLGLSPASAMVNLLQTPTVAFPLLGGRFGYGKASRELLQASKETMAGHNRLAGRLTGDEKRAYDEWVRTGQIDLTMVHNLADIAVGQDSVWHGHMRGYMEKAAWMFHHAELFNRQATLLAGYRLARQSGMNHEDAYRASVEMNNASHFNYAASNRPRFMQGPIAQVIFLFKQYSQNLMYTFLRNAYLAFKKDPQARRTLSGLLVTHALAAGLLGLPAVTTLLAVASALGGSDDDPWDAEVALKRVLADLMGDDLGQVAAHGLSRFTPWDISGRIGADHLIVPDVQEGLQGTDWYNAYVAGFLGPVVGMGESWARSAQMLARGDVGRAIENALPAVLKGPARAIRYAVEGGAKDRKGITLVDDINAAEYAGQVLGLSASRVRLAQEGKSAIDQRDEALVQRRHVLLDRFAQAVIHERGDDRAEALEAIQKWNTLHPNRVIAGMHLQHAVRMRMKHLAQAKQGIYLPPKRGLDARAYGDFADGE